MPEADFISSQIARDAETGLAAKVRSWLLVAAVEIGLFVVFVVGISLEQTGLVLGYLAAVGVAVTAVSRRKDWIDWLTDLLTGNRRCALSVLALLLALYPLVLVDNPYLIHVGTLAATFAIMALGLNIALGFCGLLDVGYSVYFAAGAYTSSQLAVHFDISFWIGLPLAGLMGALFGFVVAWPALRAQGHYLALVTLGYGLMMNLLHRNLTFLTNGTDGVINIPAPAIGAWDFYQPITIGGLELPFQINFYVLAVLLAALAVIASVRLRDSNLGRQWEAIREDEVAAKCFGINVTRLKVIAFSTGACFGGIGGAMFAHTISFVHPDNFVLLTSITILAMVIIGGMGNIFGVVLGAVLLTMIPERLREFETLRMLLFGICLVLIMIYRPQGLFPNQRRRRELEASKVDDLIARSGEKAKAAATALTRSLDR